MKTEFCFCMSKESFVKNTSQHVDDLVNLTILGRQQQTEDILSDWLDAE